MKNMSKTNKERLMEMNLQTFAAEDGLTVANDLGEVRSIDCLLYTSPSPRDA